MIEKKCRACGKMMRVDVSKDMYIAQRFRFVPVAQAYPHLSIEMRKFMLSGICPECDKQIPQY